MLKRNLTLCMAFCMVVTMLLGFTTITYAEESQQFKIDVVVSTTDAAGGTLSETGGTVEPGSEVYVDANTTKTFTFNPAEGFILSKLVYNGNEVISNGASFTTQEVVADSKLEVTFSKLSAAEPSIDGISTVYMDVVTNKVPVKQESTDGLQVEDNDPSLYGSDGSTTAPTASEKVNRFIIFGIVSPSTGVPGLEYGMIVLHNDLSFATTAEEELVIGGKSVSKYMSKTTTTENGQYGISLSGTALIGGRYYARTYVQYLDAQGETVIKYGPVKIFDLPSLTDTVEGEAGPALEEVGTPLTNTENTADVTEPTTQPEEKPESLPSSEPTDVTNGVEDTTNNIADTAPVDTPAADVAEGSVQS